MSSVVHITERMVNLLPLCTLSQACDFVVLYFVHGVLGTAIVMYVINSLMSIFFSRDWSVSIHATITLVNQLDPQKSYTKSYNCVMSVANEYRLGIIL